METPIDMRDDDSFFRMQNKTPAVPPMAAGVLVVISKSRALRYILAFLAVTLATELFVREMLGSSVQYDTCTLGRDTITDRVVEAVSSQVYERTITQYEHCQLAWTPSEKHVSLANCTAKTTTEQMTVAYEGSLFFGSDCFGGKRIYQLHPLERSSNATRLALSLAAFPDRILVGRTSRAFSVVGQYGELYDDTAFAARLVRMLVPFMSALLLAMPYVLLSPEYLERRERMFR